MGICGGLIINMIGSSGWPGFST